MKKILLGSQLLPVLGTCSGRQQGKEMLSDLFPSKKWFCSKTVWAWSSKWSLENLVRGARARKANIT